ncbi:unnamed protein product [Arctogadus glacialis]
MRSSWCLGFEKNPGTFPRARNLNLEEAHLSLVSVTGLGHWSRSLVSVIGLGHWSQSLVSVKGHSIRGEASGVDVGKTTHLQGHEIAGNEMRSTVADVQPGR